jgi:hypothetical protein
VARQNMTLNGVSHLIRDFLNAGTFVSMELDA